MKLKHENYDQVTVVAIQGELSIDEVDTLTRLVEERLSGSTRDFVFDLHQMDSIDSKGLETLIWVQERAGENLGQVRLVSLTDNVRSILRVTRLDHYFDTHGDMDAALRSLR